VKGLAVEALGLPDLHNLPEIHHGDSVRDMADHRQIMRNEYVGRSQLTLDVIQQVEDSCLHGDIQGGDRLVEDDHVRLKREGTRNANALALAARKFVRVARRMFLAQANEADEVTHAHLSFRTRPRSVFQRFSDIFGNPQARMKRSVRILEYQLKVPAHESQPLAVELYKILPSENNLAARGSHQLQDAATESRLTAS
jgi:hypothetical protein